MKTPSTITVRRNPVRKARATPSSIVPLSQPLTTPSEIISSFPINDILSINLPQNPTDTPNTSPPVLIDNLKVYLRIRPLTVQTNVKKIAESKNVWPKVKTVGSKSKVGRSSEVCVMVNDDKCSVTVQDVKRTKSEVYDGFSRVFPSESTQSDVYGEMVKPIVDDFVKGKCGMLAAMGPSGSGKTHTVFGSGREPGMVPLALRDIFRQNKRRGAEMSRTYYLSMMEISNERGKGEKFIDLLHDGGHVFMQQSVVKGTQEVVICDAQQAESFIARGMLKRATATTNSNSQSSRSQCIINIRSASQNCDGDDDGKGSTTLSIVDLAGAEKEKKTGNQGTRLLESNFINNTSMVFSLCLRSLLEHQKNRNKLLPKHYHNSLLTRYMRDYLEGKKRMALILTVKPGIEDYPDTTFLLRQASPFANIKFKNVEEPVNLNCSKRPSEALPRSKQLKRMKFGDNEASVVDEGTICRGLSTDDCKKIAEVVILDGLTDEIGDIKDENLTEIPVLSDESAEFGTRTKLAEERDHDKSKLEKDRAYQTLLGLSKAFWNALKQHKKESEVLKIENQQLRDDLSSEKARNLGLENELNNEKLRLLDLENELKELRIHCESRETSTNMIPASAHDYISDHSQHQMTEQQEMSTEVLPYCIKVLEQTAPNDKSADNWVIDTFAVVSCSTTVDKEDYQGNGTSPVDSCSRDQDLSACINEDDDKESNSYNIDIADCEVAFTQSTSACSSTSSVSEQGIKITGDDKSLEVESGSVFNESSCLECESVADSPDDEDLKDARGRLTQYQINDTVPNDKSTDNSVIDTIAVVSCSTTVDKEDCQGNGTRPMDSFSRDQDLSACINEDDDKELSSYNIDTVDCEVAFTQSTSACSSTSSVSEQGIKITRDDKSLEVESGSVFNESSCLERESVADSPDDEDLKDARGRLTQHQINETCNENQIASVAADSDNVLSSPVSLQKDDNCLYMGAEQTGHDNKEQLDPQIKNLASKRRDVKVVSSSVAKLPMHSNFKPVEKPKRRLLPASSVLLKDISILDVKDENVRPKVGKGRKVVAMGDKNRTQGSLSLLHLLKDNIIQ